MLMVDKLSMGIRKYLQDKIKEKKMSLLENNLYQMKEELEAEKYKRKHVKHLAYNLSSKKGR
jgi:hypothetical protein